MTDQPSVPVPSPRPGPPPGRAADPALPPPVTGELRVDRALAVLDTLEQRDLAGHVDAFSEVHRLLQDALATLDGA